MLQEHYLRRIVILYDIAENVAWQPQWPAWLILLHHERPPVQHALRENQQLVRDVLVKGPERKLCLRRSVNAGGRGGGRSVGGAGRLSRGYRSPRAAASIAQRVSQRLNVIAQHALSFIMIVGDPWPHGQAVLRAGIVAGPGERNASQLRRTQTVHHWQAVGRRQA